MTTTTTIETSDDDLVNTDGENRAFHVAVLCWNLSPDSAEEDTDTSTDDNAMQEEEEDSTEVDISTNEEDEDEGSTSEDDSNNH